MNASITGITMDIEKFNEVLADKYREGNANDMPVSVEIEDLIEWGKTFAGKQAGICYMADTYFGTKVSDPEAAIKRWHSTIKNAHHSIGDHVNVTVYFENVPKIFAMIMNSLQMYSTSEKSARYTEMAAVDGKEKELYDKWKAKLEPIIAAEYGDKMEEAQIKKLAQENARYFISLFTPATSFAYTTSIVQWAKILKWVPNFLRFDADMRDFKDKVLTVLEDVWKLPVFEYLRDEEIVDNKCRSISFFDYHYDADLIGDSYQIRYTASGSSVAQLERHRTTILKIRPIKDMYYVPDILLPKDQSVVNFGTPEAALADEWLADMRSIATNYPQGMIFEVLESGTIEGFELKLKERLCGRAQYETMRVVEEQVMRFIESAHCIDDYLYIDEDDESYPEYMRNCTVALTDYALEVIKNWYEVEPIEVDGQLKEMIGPRTKCQLCGECVEPCVFPGIENFKRSI